MSRPSLHRRVALLLVVSVLVPLSLSAAWAAAQTPQLRQPSIIHKMESAHERLEMTVNTSRILTMEQKILQVQVNNPDLLQPTILSPHEVQIAAKSPGVTQVNLWADDEQVYVLDVIVHGDARELALLLEATFPKSALKVIPVNNGVLLSGHVNRPEDVGTMVRIAEEYYPKVINNMTVVGVQQVMLHVKVMEVSRTKLRSLGFDFAEIASGATAISSVSGLITDVANNLVTVSGGETFKFSVHGSDNAFFGVLDALRQDNLMKVLAEPALVAISGRAASFSSGGEFPILVPQSLGTVSIEFKKFGTQVDFVPIVLGNGRIRLEVRPRVSEIDTARSVTIGDLTVPALLTREVDTAVELQAGQTLAIAGLVQSRTEAENKGLPWLSELPYVGLPFRRVEQKENEVELLIMVTPELVDPLDADEIPPCGPGMRTRPPTDCELFFQGHLEVPNCCPGSCGLPGGCAGDGGVLLEQGTVVPQGHQVLGPAPAAAHNRQGRFNRQDSPANSRATPQISDAGFIGPIGYDVIK